MQKHDEGGGNAPPDPNVMHARIQMLFEALREVKSLLKGIEDAVGIIKVFDLQLKQQNEEISRLETAIREYRSVLNTEVQKLEEDIRNSRAAATKDLDEVKSNAAGTKSELDKRVSFVQGIIATVSVVAAVAYSFAVWSGGRLIDMTDEHDRYIHTLKTLDAEDHLRKALSAPSRIDLEVKPVVRSPSQRDNAQGEDVKEDVPRM